MSYMLSIYLSPRAKSKMKKLKAMFASLSDLTKFREQLPDWRDKQSLQKHECFDKNTD